jgi:hypothetical protein
MNKTAVEAAYSCLEQAKDAVKTMESADGFDAMEKAWTNFLIMSNRIYTKLEQGAKTDGASTAWFGRKKHERRKDPLLRYIKNARDADEHGLERVTERKPGGVEVKFNADEPDKPVNMERGHISTGSSGIEMSFKFGEPTSVMIQHTPPSVRLVEVTNYGDKYQPPDSDPITVARRGVTFLETLIAETESLIP